MTDPWLPTRLLPNLRQRLARAATLLKPVRARLTRHKRVLVSLAALFLALLIFGALAPLTATAGFLIMAAIIVGPDSDDNDEATAAAVQDAEPPPSRDAASWRTMVDAFPDAVVALDQNYSIVHFNGLFGEFFPRARAGIPFSHISRNPELNDALERAVHATDPVVVEIFERVPVERRFSATVSRLGGREVRRGLPMFIITFRDLTEQDKLAQMRADFIANASHELRTPLASLRGFVETLQGPARDDPSARERFLSIMSSQATRMTRLIDDLLSLSRVEMRVHLSPKGVVDLNEVASYVAQALEPLADASKIKILVTKGDGPVRIRGERDEIVQVLQNLIHNAIKYGRDGGRVEVGVSRVLDGTPPQPRVLVAVADDGIGIAPEHLPRLTERFYRANVAASREKGGTGLGLAIAKHIVIRHRGELRISSEIGNGSTFSVLFDEFSPRG